MHYVETGAATTLGEFEMSVSASQPLSDSAAQRRTMVDRQIRTFDVTDASLLTAMLETPREPFLPPELTSLAYSDAALPVGRDGAGQMRRLPAPMILARMIQALQVGPKDKCLEIAGGGGYGAALLARIGASALAVENAGAFTTRAQAAFVQLGLDNAHAETAALVDAGAAADPFDAILVNGAVERPPDELLSRLANRGRLVAIARNPDDPAGAAFATLWTRSETGFGHLPLFNAGSPVLAGFALAKTFAF